MYCKGKNNSIPHFSEVKKVYFLCAFLKCSLNALVVYHDWTTEYLWFKFPSTVNQNYRYTLFEKKIVDKEVSEENKGKWLIQNMRLKIDRDNLYIR